MNSERINEIIGYSGFVLFEECYEYNENSCYLADNLDSANEFMKACGYRTSDYRIDKITLKDILDDYGCSSGEYAMESIAFNKFKEIAEENGNDFEFEPYEYDSNLLIVSI